MIWPAAQEPAMSLCLYFPTFAALTSSSVFSPSPVALLYSANSPLRRHGIRNLINGRFCVSTQGRPDKTLGADSG
jgi:hypothetical protein